MLTKKQIVDAVHEMPANEIDVDAFVEKLYLVDQLTKAEADIIAGRTCSNEDMKQTIDSWRQSRGQNLPKAI